MRLFFSDPCMLFPLMCKLRSHLHWVYTCSGASAVKESGHFEVRKSSSQVTRMHFFYFKKLTTFFGCHLQNTGRQGLFTVKIKQIGPKAVRYGDIFIFCLHYYRSKALCRARQGGGSTRSFDLARPGVAPPLPVRISFSSSEKTALMLAVLCRATCVTDSLSTRKCLIDWLNECTKCMPIYLRGEFNILLLRFRGIVEILL